MHQFRSKYLTNITPGMQFIIFGGEVDCIHKRSGLNNPLAIGTFPFSHGIITGTNLKNLYIIDSIDI